MFLGARSLGAGEVRPRPSGPAQAVRPGPGRPAPALLAAAKPGAAPSRQHGARLRPYGDCRSGPDPSAQVWPRATRPLLWPPPGAELDAKLAGSVGREDVGTEGHDPLGQPDGFSGGQRVLYWAKADLVAAAEVEVH